MKSLLFPFVILLLLSCNNEKKEAPKPAPEIPVAPADAFSVIREKIKSIDELENSEKKQFEVSCGKKIKVEYTRHNGEVIRIAVDFLKESDKEIKADYYYENNKLIYIFEVVRKEGEDQKTYSSYIENDKVIRYFWDHGESQCKKCEFNASSKEYKLLKANNVAEIEAVLCQ
ncbi:MAG: hypothetical protein J0G98_18825 [Terrimonas ferruginea]|uniref:hypothetical protein n=1 Tax=Terrimonas ferruginea TaxID=249 RepID=UPI00092906F7|nr:hypothetical protein [Terrimonas ferruginea]MBN8785122.1 hypothetical protein [Terrimonas ferruginea]OJW41535.1 MAG: hypothetical protein BGO56_10270 [Sphingobacteriales bacterium 48-107]